MSNREKIQALQNLQQNGMGVVDKYYETMERIGDLKYNYSDYMTSEAIDCDRELRRLTDSDYDLTCALLTMLLREDHFCNGSFGERYRTGQIQPILQKMIELLQEKEV